MIKMPWLEKYRPSSLDEVVLDNKILEKLREYIKEPMEMPHLLFVGTPGLGKCVSYDTEIEVYVDDETYNRIKDYEIK